MKKKFVARIVIIVILLIGILGYFVYNMVVEQGKKYETETIKNPQYFILKQGENYGVIDKTGKTIIDVNYESIIIPNPEKAVFICYQNDRAKVLNQDKEEIFTEYEQIEPIRLKNIASSYMYEKSVLIYQKKGKMGLINLEGKKLGKCDYDQIEAMPYKEGELLVKQGENYGVINIKGNILVKPEYTQITLDNYYTEEDGYKNAGYIISKKTEDGYRYGYINKNGKEILEPEFNELIRITDIKDNENPYFISARNGQYGVFKGAEAIINNEYQSIRYDESSNTFVVEKSKKYGVSNLEGKIIMPIQYNQIDITGIYLYARKASTIEVYDREGNLTNRTGDTAIVETDNEKYNIKIDSTDGTVYSIVDKNENELTQTTYSYIEHLEGEYFIASQSNGKLGIINASGEEKLQIKYDSIEILQNTDILKTTIAEEKMTYLFTPDLKEMVKMQNAIIDVNDKYIKVYNDNETKYFDNSGNEVSSSKVLANQKIFASQKDGKWGFVDNNGNVVVEYKYDKTTDFNEYGYAGIKLGNKWGIIDENGAVILEPVYEFNSYIEPSFIGEYYKVSYGFGEIYYTNGK